MREGRGGQEMGSCVTPAANHLNSVMHVVLALLKPLNPSN
jgi:hypothetical protein